MASAAGCWLHKSVTISINLGKPRTSRGNTLEQHTCPGDGFCAVITEPFPLHFQMLLIKMHGSGAIQLCSPSRNAATLPTMPACCLFVISTQGLLFVISSHSKPCIATAKGPGGIFQLLTGTWISQRWGQLQPYAWCRLLQAAFQTPNFTKSLYYPKVQDLWVTNRFR